jgi:hypothetical protein
MSPEILLVRDNEGYRVLHGYLHLASVLSTESEALVEASGEGKVKVVKSGKGISIAAQGQSLPLLGPCAWSSAAARMAAIDR